MEGLERENKQKEEEMEQMRKKQREEVSRLETYYKD